MDFKNDTITELTRLKNSKSVSSLQTKELNKLTLNKSTSALVKNKPLK